MEIIHDDFFSNCCEAKIIMEDYYGHGMCSDCGDNCVPVEESFNPHKSALVAIHVYKEEWMKFSSTNPNDFWISLTNRKKRVCRAVADLVMEARPETKEDNR